MTAITFMFSGYELTIPQKDDSYFQHVKDISIKERTDKKMTLYGPMILNNVYHGSLYSNILDNTPTTFTFDLLLHALKIGLEYFKSMQISAKTKTRIQCWVKSLGKYSYTWTELLDKPNYSLELFSNRYWPFYNVESKDWQDITLESKAVDYATEIVSDTDNKTVNNSNRDYKLETTVSHKYNNYLGYSVMDPESYPDMEKLLTRLRTIMDIGLPTLMFEAILRFMITPSACHIIKETTLWELIKPLMENPAYKHIFFHYMYYSMFILHHEDTIMFSQVRRNYRIIFSHTQALCMPTTYHMHMELDPYIQQLTGETYIAESIPFYIRCKRHLNSKKIFERRFFLATGGALTGIPLHKYKAAVSGSILIPCLTYTELEENFVGSRFDTSRQDLKATKTNIYDFCDKLTEKEKNFISFLEYYYPSYHSLTDKDYINKVMTKHSTVKKIELKSNTDEKSSDEPVKTKYNQVSDIDISISAETYDIFKELATMLATQIQENCKHIGDVWIRKIQTMGSFKYEIYGPGLIRPIDLFRIPYGPDKMTKKFHVPIVRTWYDGRNSKNGESNNSIPDKDIIIDQYWETKLEDDIDNDYNLIDKQSLDSNIDGYEKGIHTYRSCICASLSGVNDSYKWFSCNKVPVDVVLKYAQRGISTILNKKEIEALISFMKISERWSVFINRPDFDVCGMMTLNHIFYHPDSIDAGIRFGLRKLGPYYTNFYTDNQPTGIARIDSFKKNFNYCTTLVDTSVVEFYSRKQPVGIAKTETNYGANLAVKNNNKVLMPDISIINKFVDRIEQSSYDEYSDGDSY
jgi:hypothetical protein